MNIALFIGGRSKLYKECLLEQLNYTNKNSNHKIYLFGHFNEEPDENLISSFTSVSFEIFNPPNWSKNIIYKRYETNVHNTLSMYYSNKKAYELIDKYQKENNIRFDQIIKFRPDIINIQLPIFPECIEDNTIYTYNDYHYGGLNDQIAIGNIESMTKYCNLYDSIEKYINNIVFHPESLLLYHILVNNINVKFIDYPYTLDNRRK